MDVQNWLDVVGSTARDTRKDYHMCLGDLLDRLREADPEGLGYLERPHSYWGYCADLALEPAARPIRVWELINQLSDVIDTELTGYKGGEFLMEADTTVWIASYGNTGLALIDFDPKHLTITTKEIC